MILQYLGASSATYFRAKFRARTRGCTHTASLHVIVPDVRSPLGQVVKEWMVVKEWISGILAQPGKQRLQGMGQTLGNHLHALAAQMEAGVEGQAVGHGKGVG